MGKDFKEASKVNWHISGEQVSEDQLKIGCLQRIATSLENMEAPYLKLLGEVETQVNQCSYLGRRNKELIAETEHLSRCNSSLRGAITKLKKEKGR